MIRPFILSVASVAALACACPASAMLPPSSALPDAERIGARVVARSVATTVRPAGNRPLVRPRTPVERGPATALIRVRTANRDAVREPTTEGFLGAAQIYPWSEGALYRLYAAPGVVSDIALQPGEVLVSVAAGDTVRWVIGDTASGSGATRRTHILVKPSAAGLATNLVIATDRRIYHVEARSNARTAMTGIGWTYPAESLLALDGASAAPAEPAVSDVSVEQLDFDYRIEGDAVPWRPVRVFDDGRQVFIQFPPALAQGEAPPLFVTGDGGRAELVNYRIRGRYYIVDRLFSAAELRMGGKRQQVVRILRDASAQAGGRGR